MTTGHEEPEIAYERHNEIESTHNYVKENIAEFIHRMGTKETVCVLADLQTGGIGTYDDLKKERRAWIGEKGNIFCTAVTKVPQPLLVDPETKCPIFHTLPMLMASMILSPLVAMFDSEEVPIKLGWPNDFFCGSNKVGGLLCELPLVPSKGLAYFLPATIQKAQWASKVEDVPGDCSVPIIVSFGMNLKPLTNPETGEVMFHALPQRGLDAFQVVNAILTSVTRRLRDGYLGGCPRELIGHCQNYLHRSGRRVHLRHELVELLDESGESVDLTCAVQPSNSPDTVASEGEKKFRLEGVDIAKGMLWVSIPGTEVYGNAKRVLVQPRSIRKLGAGPKKNAFPSD